MMKNNSKITKSLTSIFVGLVVLGVFSCTKETPIKPQPLTRMRLLNKKRVLQIPPLGALRPQELPLVKLH